MAQDAADDAPPDSTLADVRPVRKGPPSAWARRGPALVLAALVAAGLAGLLGVNSTTTTRSESGYTLTLEHAWVTRTGLDTPWQLRVEADEPLTEDVVVRVTADYFDMWEHQGWYPEPSDVQRDDEYLYLTFAAPPAGRTLVIDFDAYIQPASQVGRRGDVAVMADDVPVAEIEFETRVLP